MFKFSVELNERIVSGLLALGALGLLLFFGAVQIEQVENLAWGLVGVVAGRGLPGSGRPGSAGGPAL